MLYRILLIVIIFIPAALLLPRLFTGLYSLPLIYSAETAPARPVAIIFGAGLWRDGSPTPVLRDRVATGVRLYQEGKVQQLLMSGGYTHAGYNEPEAMRRYALSLGVPEDAILLDHAGQRTYDTCYRAAHVFGIEKPVLVTQSFHLPRAVYLCNALGLPAVGVSSDLRQYRRASMLFWNLREIPATITALWDVHVARPTPLITVIQPQSHQEAQ